MLNEAQLSSARAGAQDQIPCQAVRLIVLATYGLRGSDDRRPACGCLAMNSIFGFGAGPN